MKTRKETHFLLSIDLKIRNKSNKKQIQNLQFDYYRSPGEKPYFPERRQENPLQNEIPAGYEQNL